MGFKGGRRVGSLKSGSSRGYLSRSHTSKAQWWKFGPWLAYDFMLHGGRGRQFDYWIGALFAVGPVSDVVPYAFEIAG